MRRTLSRITAGNDSIGDSNATGHEMGTNSLNNGGVELVELLSSQRSRPMTESPGSWPRRILTFISSPSNGYITFSILAIVLLCVSSAMQMFYKEEKCPLLVPSESRALSSPNICCNCVCDVVNASCHNTVSAPANPKANPLVSVMFYSNYTMGIASLLAYVIAFMQIYYAHKDENIYLSVSIVLVFTVQFVRNIFWFWASDATPNNWLSGEAILYLAPLCLAFVCTVITGIYFWRYCQHFGSILYTRKCVNATRQRLFGAYQFLNAMQWLELQLILGGIVMIIFTNHNTETRGAKGLLLTSIALFLGDLMANFVVTYSLRREMPVAAIITILMKLLSGATWFILAQHYRHCYDFYVKLGHFVRSIYEQDRYLWPKAMGTDDSIVAFIDRTMQECMSPRMVHSYDLPFVMATILISVAVVRSISCLVFGWLICFFTNEGELWVMFSKSNPEVARQDAVVELE